MKRWIDKPAMVQCSHCHALGHNKASRACPLSRDSVKCYICGGSHRSEKHDQHCDRKHAKAGVCDCKNFKCLNCRTTGHNCRDQCCPARELYRPKFSRRAGKARARNGSFGGAAETPDTPQEEVANPDGDLYDNPLRYDTPARTPNPLPTPNGVHQWEDEMDTDWGTGPARSTNYATGNGPPGASNHASGSGLPGGSNQEEATGTLGGISYVVPGIDGWEYADFPETSADYSPSHPQSGANPMNHD